MIKGTKDFVDHELKIWAKNENHMSWLDGETFIMSPDLLQCVYQDNGDPITNTDIAEGDHIAVVEIANPLYRTDEGLKIMGPSHYGFKEIDYIPMENKLK